MIQFIKDKDAIWETDNYDVVLLGTSINNMLTNGLQSKMRIKYPELDVANKSTNYGDTRKLGKRLNVGEKPIVSLMYICKFPRSNRETLDYEALEKCLVSANEEFKGKNVMTTILGTSIFDGNGDREKVLEIINRTCTDMNLTIYDYVQLRKRDECYKIRGKMLTYGKLHGYEKGRELLENQDRIFREQYLEYYSEKTWQKKHGTPNN